jgi:maltooligosyltrehalose trehalohydrolase
VLSAATWALRFFTPDHRDDRVLIVNLGPDLNRAAFAEPLLAPPQGLDWTVRFSTEDPAYGGSGAPDLVLTDGWYLAGESALVLAPCERTERRGRVSADRPSEHD